MSGKKKRRYPIRQRLGRTQRTRTCVRRQPGSIYSKRREHSDFCAENMFNLRGCLVVNSFQYGINSRRST